jgi:glycerol kinase
LLFGTIDCWLVWKLSGGKLHITDASNASRTMLFNIIEGVWDKDLMKLMDIPELMMPRVVNSSELMGVTDPSLFNGAEIPIGGIAGDQQAALFGQSCFKPGMAKNTYGTGCFMLMQTGTNAVISDAGLLTTIAWKIDDKIYYALEGSVFHAGSAVRWLRDQLKLITDAADSESLCEESGPIPGLYMVPAFSGLGAPYWDMDAQALFTGMTLQTGKAQLVRAVVEAIAYQSCDVLQAMAKDSGLALTELRVDGGATINNFLMQFQADVLAVPVIRPAMVEATALGAALLAGRSSGFWKDDELFSADETSTRFKPLMQEYERQRLYQGWLAAVRKARYNGR